MTRERVRQIELRALKKLRRMGPVKINENGEFVCAPPVKQPGVHKTTISTRPTRTPPFKEIRMAIDTAILRPLLKQFQLQETLQSAWVG